jgi:hypothetical protein
VEYSETKEATTSGQGIFSVVVGDGSILTKTGNFSDINWKNSPKFLKVEMDPSGGTNFALLGTSRLQAVPFAYYANGVDADNIQGTLSIAKGGTGVGSITALKTSLGIDQVNNTSDANKPLSKDAQAALGTKVDKVTGKELSSNDYSAAEKTKLAAITGTNTGDQDLTGFATTAALAAKANTADVTTSLGLKANTADLTTGLATKVDKVTGKELSSNDYTTAEKTKLNAITGTNTGDQDLTGFATTAALAAKANTTDVTTSLGLKANTADLTTGLATKVDKVTGKELSSNDYSAAEKTKLAAITGTNTGDQDLTGFATTTALALKANTADVTTSLGLKANTSEVTTGLALKENVANKSTATDLGAVATSDVFFPTQKAVKTYVDAQINTGGISDGSILTRHIADANITTALVANAAITDAKLATGISKSKVSLENVENTALSTWAGTNNIITLGTITTGTWSGTAIAIASGGTGVATTTANTFFAGPNGTSGAPSFRTLVAADLPTNSTGYIQNAPDATQTGSIDISGAVKIGTTLNVNGIYIGVGKNNQSTSNTAVGNNALHGLDDGSSNASFGTSSMKNNNGGIENTALGSSAMLNSTTGNYNTATGSLALSSNTGAGNSGSYNVANGYKALLLNQTGDKNVGVGYNALVANRTGSNNTAIGNQSDVGSGDLTNATALGNGAIVSASNTIQLGNSSVSSVITSGAITAPSFIGTLNGNAITGTITNTGKVIVGASSAASASAVLEVSSTTQGFLPPRMSYLQRTQITSPEPGLVVWCRNCGVKGELQVYSENNSWTNLAGSTAAVFTPIVGTSYEGGKIAYVLVDGDTGYDENTPHGLIAAIEDQSTAIRWYNGSNTTTGATGTAIGTGLANTNAIIASQGGTASSYAAGLARAYSGGGYTDWYLPSTAELNKLRLNRGAIGNFADANYWSSTEYSNDDYAMLQLFPNGTEGGYHIQKFSTYRVRAVRSF